MQQKKGRKVGGTLYMGMEGGGGSMGKRKRCNRRKGER